MERTGHHYKPDKRRPCPPKLTDRARRALIRDATKTPKITLKELQRSTVEMGVSVHRTTLSHALHKVGLYGSMPKKK